MNSESILTSSAAAYLRGVVAERIPPASTAGRSALVGDFLDEGLNQALACGEEDLAGCLLVLALARRRDGGLDRCGLALRHVLAELSIDLPLPDGPAAGHVPDHVLDTDWGKAVS